MNYTDLHGVEREISSEEMDNVYASIGTLLNELDKEHVAEYFRRPMHDADTYKSFKHGVTRLQEMLSKVADA